MQPAVIWIIFDMMHLKICNTFGTQTSGTTEPTPMSISLFRLISVLRWNLVLLLLSIVVTWFLILVCSQLAIVTLFSR